MIFGRSTIIMNFFKQMVSDGDMAVSSTRTMMLATCAVILFRFMAFNIGYLITGKPGFDFSPTDVTLLGVVLAGKIAQSITERK